MFWKNWVREPAITSQILVVSAASPTYFRSLLQLLLSLRRHGHTSCIVYDLGLSDRQRCRLLREFGWIELRSLPAGPPHLSDWSNYAWKPTVLAEVLEESRVPVLWLDSACVLVNSFESIERHVRFHGLWVPLAGRGCLEERTHPATLRQMGVEESICKERFRAGGVCAFDPGQPRVLELVRQWRKLSWIPELLAPAGSNRENHRYDQALLTILLSRSELNPSLDEIDISSSCPVAYLRTRNKVANWIPLGLDALVRVCFAVRRHFDVLIWKWRDRAGQARTDCHD